MTSGTVAPPTTDQTTGVVARDQVPRRDSARAAFQARRRGWSRWLPALSTVVVVVAVIAIVLWQMQLHLLLTSTTTAGGDTGAHFMLPRYLGWNLMPHGQLTGWDPAWYDGFPLYTYYFLLPDSLVAVFGHIISYDITFKWATVLGSLLLPICAWAMGRLFGLRAPIPAALAALTLPYLFDYTFTIDGGNLFSTLAGEYAYSLSVALALLFLGLLARGLRTGKGRTVTALALACCILAHIVPAMFALVGAGLLIAIELLAPRWRLHDDGFSARDGVSRAPGREGVRSRTQAVVWGLTTVALGGLLTAFWLVPFGLDQAYANSMGYTNVHTYEQLLLPGADWWALIVAALATVLAIVRRSRFGLLVAMLGGLSALGLVVDPLASLYNTRLLPLWFLCVYLMVGWGIGVTCSLVAQWWHRDRLARWVYSTKVALDQGGYIRRRPHGSRWLPGAVVGPLVALAVACLVVLPPFVVSAQTLSKVGITVGANEVSGWATWNYTGYEGKPAYPEYHALVETMAAVGQKYGCGQSMWEYNSNLNRFGTPMALMLLPYWTNGCVGSMEGLLFESSATTPYHFLNQAELSDGPSEPMTNKAMVYGPVNVTEGVEHLQLLGVKYFMASSPDVQAAAKADPSLRLVDSTGPWASPDGGVTDTTTWDIFQVLNSPLVSPLTNEPAVMKGIKPGQASWLAPSVAWYDDPARWNVELAQDGPANWPRVKIGETNPPRVPVAPTTVTRAHEDGEKISFHVSHVGSPVLVKVSYFPNWHATGANGPWRVTPNLMVVVPTSHNVTLNYSANGSDHLGDLGFLVGVLGLVGLGLWPALSARRKRRSTASS